MEPCLQLVPAVLPAQSDGPNLPLPVLQCRCVSASVPPVPVPEKRDGMRGRANRGVNAARSRTTGRPPRSRSSSSSSCKRTNLPVHEARPPPQWKARAVRAAARAKNLCLPGEVPKFPSGPSGTFTFTEVAVAGDSQRPGLRCFRAGGAPRPVGQRFTLERSDLCSAFPRSRPC